MWRQLVVVNKLKPQSSKNKSCIKFHHKEKLTIKVEFRLFGEHESDWLKGGGEAVRDQRTRTRSLYTWKRWVVALYLRFIVYYLSWVGR